MDRLHEETTSRTHQISDMNIKFGFLMSLSYLMDPSNNIAMKIHHLTEAYDYIIAREQQRKPLGRNNGLAGTLNP